MALFWRIWTAVIAVSFVVLSIFVGLATLQFDEINSALVGERLVVLADRTAAPFQAAVKLGLPLSSVRNAAALLERARQTDDSISAIHVFDGAGNIVHSTRPEASATLAHLASAASRKLPDSRWYGETSDGFLARVDIGGLGEPNAGGILIAYPADGNNTQVLAMGAQLAIVALVVMVGTAIISAVFLRRALNPEILAFDAMDAAVAEFERDSWRSAAGRNLTGTNSGFGSGLRELLDTADLQYRATGRAIAAAQTDDRNENSASRP